MGDHGKEEDNVPELSYLFKSTKLPDAHSRYADARYVIFGVPFDGTSSFRRGSRLGPDSVRYAYDNLESFDPYYGVNFPDVPITDLGNLEVGEDAAEVVGGIAPVPEMIENGMVVSLGTDSSGSNNALNMFEAMKFSSLWIKNDRWNPAIINSKSILDMATVNGAGSLGTDRIGTLETGKLADIVLVDTSQANMTPTNMENAVSNIVYSANPSNVKYVIIDGKVLKDDGKLVHPAEGVEAEDEFY